MCKKVVKAILAVTMGIVIMFGLMGFATILLTITMYFLVFYTGIKLISTFVKDTNAKANYKLLLTTVLTTAFAGELTLKYLVKYNLTYGEINGKTTYRSPYKRMAVKNIVNIFKYGPNRGFILHHDPNTTEKIIKPEFRYQHQFNSLGLRDSEPKSDSTLFNIVELGDSFTEGVGAPADSTWPAIFKSQLSTKYPALNTQTINAGIRASDPFFELTLLKERLLHFNPKLVILALNESDITDIIALGGKERYTHTSILETAGPRWEFFYSFSYIFRALAKSVLHTDGLLLTPAQRIREENLALKKIEHCVLNDYKNLAAQYNFKLVVVLHPVQTELENKEFSLQKLAESFSKDSSFQTINLFEAYSHWHETTGKPYSSLYWPLDRHHNSAGYQLWANILAEEVKLEEPNFERL
ncbi:MAG: SGNH/GDSL hydrolase family protein [Chitinophagales bacterium]|nr:SGNH/GDSL hydrolase family protein [Chitinophagales bacterium]